MKKMLCLFILGVLISSLGCSSISEIKATDFNLTQKGIVVVMFCKDMCPSCDTQSSILSEISKEYPLVKFYKVKAYNMFLEPTNKDMVEAFDLKWTPTTVLLIEGKEVYRWTTLHSKDSITTILNKGIVHE